MNDQMSNVEAFIFSSAVFRRKRRGTVIALASSVSASYENFDIF